MADTERDDAYYHLGGVPITPQARKFGYEFPVYVSKNVWSQQCMWDHGRGTSTDRRILELLQYAYDGMIKALSVSDDFVSYWFKVWYWQRDASKTKKKKGRTRLGARLFRTPEDGTPWLYIYNPAKDTLDELTSGEAPVADDDTVGSSETSEQLPGLSSEVRNVQQGEPDFDPDRDPIDFST